MITWGSSLFTDWLVTLKIMEHLSSPVLRWAFWSPQYSPGMMRSSIYLTVISSHLIANVVISHGHKGLGISQTLQKVYALQIYYQIESPVSNICMQLKSYMCTLRTNVQEYIINVCLAKWLTINLFYLD